MGRLRGVRPQFWIIRPDDCLTSNEEMFSQAITSLMRLNKPQPAVCLRDQPRPLLCRVIHCPAAFAFRKRWRRRLNGTYHQLARCCFDGVCGNVHDAGVGAPGSSAILAVLGGRADTRLVSRWESNPHQRDAELFVQRFPRRACGRWESPDSVPPQWPRAGLGTAPWRPRPFVAPAGRLAVQRNHRECLKRGARRPDARSSASRQRSGRWCVNRRWCGEASSAVRRVAMPAPPTNCGARPSAMCRYPGGEQDTSRKSSGHRRCQRRSRRPVCAVR